MEVLVTSGAVSNFSDGVFSVSLCLLVPASTPHAVTAASTCQASSKENADDLERTTAEALLWNLFPCWFRLALPGSCKAKAVDQASCP